MFWCGYAISSSNATRQKTTMYAIAIFLANSSCLCLFMIIICLIPQNNWRCSGRGGVGAVARLFPLWNAGLPLLHITPPTYTIILTIHTNLYT